MTNPHLVSVRSVWRRARAALLATTLLGSLLGGSVTTQAAPGVLYANTPALGVTQLTLPSPVWLPALTAGGPVAQPKLNPDGTPAGHIWVGDNGLTFCRVDPASGGTYSVNASTCDTTAKSPAQAVMDPRPILDALNNDTGKRYVYIADNSSKSAGAVRVTYDATTETIVPNSGMVLGDGSTAGRTNSIALNPYDGKLYIAHIKGGSIFRIVNPNLDQYMQYTEIIGRTSDGRGVRGGMAFACGSKPSATCDLYIGEVGGNGVSIIPDAQACNAFGFLGFGGCQATVTSITTNSPGGLTSDGGSWVFVGDAPLSLTGTVLRYNVDTDTQDIVSSVVPPYQTSYPTAHTQATYTGITGIAIDPQGNLYVGDDPTVGAALPPPTGQGKMWKIGGVYQSTVQCNPGATPAVTTACLDALGTPGNPAQMAPPPTLAKPATLIAFGATAPDGVIWLPGSQGGHYWVADHTQGLCRLDAAPDTPGLFATSPTSCDPNGMTGSPGQPVYDATHNFVFVPDAAVKSPGLWRLNYDPTGTGACGKPESICNPTLIAPGAGLDNDKLVGVAIGPDGNIYAAGLKNGFIYRVQNPAGDPTTMAVDIVGITSDSRGINGSIGMLGSDLYLPENKGLSVVKNITGCALPSNNFVPCTAVQMNLPYVPFALSVATDNAHGQVYVSVASGAANGVIYRLTPTTGATLAYAASGTVPLSKIPNAIEDCTTMCQRKVDPLPMPPAGVADPLLGFHFPLGMYVDSGGNLLLGDDIMAGSRGFHGHVWSIPFAP